MQIKTFFEYELVFQVNKYTHYASTA